MTTRPSFILIHGAWHSPKCWEKVIPLLETQGYKCVAEQMVFSGQKTPITTVKAAIDQAQELIEAEVSHGRDVVVVAHSFGGLVGQSAVNGYTAKNPSKLKEGWGKIIGICYLSAIVPPANAALVDCVPSRDVLFHTSEADGWEEITKKDPRNLFYADLPKEEQESWVAQLKNLSTASLQGPSGRDGVYEGFLDVPAWYLLCTEDQAIVLPVQEGMVAAARGRGGSFTTRTLEASHSPFLSKPKETAEFILDATKAFQA